VAIEYVTSLQLYRRMNVLMTSWVAGHLPHPRCQALMCAAGTDGYAAFRQSLDPGYPEHTILLTNVDVLTIPPLDGGSATDALYCRGD
jgi:hypothetical protein